MSKQRWQPRDNLMDAHRQRAADEASVEEVFECSKGIKPSPFANPSNRVQR